MATLTRNLYIPFLDANSLRVAVGEEPVGTGEDWVQIDKSTIFDLAFNPQEQTYEFIDQANDTTYVDSYQPELPQEIVLNSSNPLYKVVFPFCMAMPKGDDAVVPVLLVMPDLETDKATDGYVWREAILSPGDLNTPAKKLSFTLKLNGSIERGTVSIVDKKATFTPSIPEVATYSAKSTKTEDK